MAATRKPISAFDSSKELLKKMPLETVMAEILDDACSELWMAAPWRWTLGVFANQNLVAAQTDYTIASTPADFLRIERAYITNGQKKIWLTPQSFIADTPAIPGVPSEIAFVSASPNNKFRISPRFETIKSGETWTLVVLYKKSAPRITKRNSTTAGVLVMDDEWFHVYRQGVLWKAYVYGDDDRAGNCTWADGRVTYTGQMALYHAELELMKRAEPLLKAILDPDPPKSEG